MTTAEWALQETIYTRLTGDTDLMALITGVFDEVPEATTYPYLVLGEVTETPDEAHDRSGIDATITLHGWSAYKGYRELAQILSQLDRILHRQPLVVEGFQKVSLAQQQHQFVRDPDPDVRHLVARYRAWLEVPPAE